MVICRSCPHNSNNQPKVGLAVLRTDEHCLACGCTLAAKTKCFSCECPLNKWEAFASQEEWDKIKETVKDISDDNSD
jgi:hypothetical protein